MCLLDLGDNVGGGSPGDGTLIAECLLRHKVRGLVVLCDAEAAERAAKAGVGAVFAGAIGGRTDELHGAPLQVRGAWCGCMMGNLRSRRCGTAGGGIMIWGWQR